IGRPCLHQQAAKNSKSPAQHATTMADASVKRIATLASKDSSLTTTDVFAVASDVARITIDSSSIPRNALSSDYELYDVPLNDLNYTAAAVDGVFAVIDHCSAALSSVIDAIAAISCEALRTDFSPFDLTDSGDGSSSKDAVAAAACFKVFFMSSKYINSEKKFLDDCVSEIPLVHGNFREVSRLLHLKARVQLKSGFRPGSVKEASMALSTLAQWLWYLGDISIRRTRFVVENSISDENLNASMLKLLDDKCLKADVLEELYASSQDAFRKKDNLLLVHNVYELLDVIRRIFSWEGVTAFVALEGSEIFVEKMVGDNGSVSEPSSGDNTKTYKKCKKKKKMVLGKGSAAFVQFIKEELLSGATTIGLEKFALDFLEFLDPRGSGFDGLRKKLKDIVESNESRRLPKIPKGTRDFANEQTAIREKAFSIVVNVFKRHGAMGLNTPLFELRETLMGKYGEEAKLIYDMEDQGGELCSLRYDLTIPFARYVAMNGLTSYRRYHIGTVYRRDNPSKGRFREFYQCDFDIAGQFIKTGPDFEVIYILTELLDELNIGNYEVKLNHRKLLDGMLAICGVPQEKFRTICSSIDKLDKQTFEQIKKEMVEQKGLTEVSADKIGTFVKLRGSPVELLSKLQEDGSEFLENSDAELALNELEILFKALKLGKCIDKIVFDLSLARGLDYYTGVIFEAVFKGDTQVGSIAAGGRYDNLIGMFSGNQVPSVGMSLGIERVFTIMMEQLQNQEIRACETQVLVSILGDDLELASELVTELWRAKLKAEFMINKTMRKHINRATALKIPYMVIVGERELNEGVVTLKDVTAETEDNFPRNQYVEKLQVLLQSTCNYCGRTCKHDVK
ncbi:hypothetical protein RD792_004599, partial [Penstemon davidsonii]